MTVAAQRGFSLVELLIFLAIVAGLFELGSWMVHTDAAARKQRATKEARYTTEAAACHDESWLLATTSGSPDRAVCPHRLHRMHVQVATHASNEEAAAVVFCECVREQGGASK